MNFFPKFFLLAPLLIAGSARAEVELPPELGASLAVAAGHCGFQLYATRTDTLLSSDESEAKRVTEYIRNQADANTFGASVLGGGVFSGGAASMVAGFLMGNGYAFWAGGAVSGGGFSLITSFMNAAKRDDWSFDKNKLGTAATKTAAGLARIVGLDPVREDALRAYIVKSTLIKIENHDKEDLNVYEVLKKATRAGKPILNEGEMRALEEIEKASNKSSASETMSDKEKIRYLTACRETLRFVTPKLKGEQRKDADAAVNKADGVLADLRAFEASHPEAAGLCPKPAPKKGEAEGQSGETSMTVE